MTITLRGRPPGTSLVFHALFAIALGFGIVGCGDETTQGDQDAGQDAVFDALSDMRVDTTGVDTSGEDSTGVDTLGGDTTSDADCAPSCDGLDCGDDGCGGSCGECDVDASCDSGICVCLVAPPDCADGNACTADVLNQGPGACDFACANELVDTCANGDGCCPAGCDDTTDDDCSALCGNSVVDPGETCDPPGDCPTSCDDGNGCTIDTLTGNPAACSAACSTALIETCGDGDGCCPSGCDDTNDSDCSSSCDNGVIDPGETCDPPSSCPTDCEDGNACTIDTLTGDAANCNAACARTTIGACADGDGCCPPGCDDSSDTDCPSSCGDGIIDAGETCDPPSSCPTTCDDGVDCTQDVLTGNAASCTASCSVVPIITCGDGDGCCPGGCDDTVDDDCSATCGNDVVEPGETCDPPATCPTTCDDDNACTNDVTSGSAAGCNMACSYTDVTTCASGDGCCPLGCDNTIDAECPVVCGNDVVESGETCDPPGTCPTNCDDGNGCTNDTLLGSASSCTAECLNDPIGACAAGDGCCPATCNSLTDGDCLVACGNAAVEAGETCDPPSSCPASCADDGDACTDDALAGIAAECTASCPHTTISACTDGDGCCPATCSAANDTDCGPVCGDGNLDPGETCDPPATCPTVCNDGDSCTTDTLSGDASTCDVSCTSVSIDTCVDADGCCPAICNGASDSDCNSACNNGVIEPGETCDPRNTCPNSCDDNDGCTTDTLIGSRGQCTAECLFEPLAVCADGDGCCGAGCDATTDSDCSAVCDNGVLEPGETCDPQSSCPTACDDGDICTDDVLIGSVADCDASCTSTPTAVCVDGDGCCGVGCDSTTDVECPVVCGNGVLETGEYCDPPSSCPTACDDGDACTTDALIGNAASCTARCTTTPIISCANDDGCCLGGCNATNDNDCGAVCGNSVRESGETCDPPGSCPDCVDGDDCTLDNFSGAASSCDVVCLNDAVLACTDSDGCCPGGCNAGNDDDCPIACGDGSVDGTETCDPPGTCPDCVDGDACTLDNFSGDPSTCDVICLNDPASCANGDGCCPSGCTIANDDDCGVVCGDGSIDGAETCDPPGSCPDCVDGDVCTQDNFSGDPSTCNVVCLNDAVGCANGDTCCPSGCNAGNDDDCAIVCGDGSVDGTETCDPPGSCPDCVDGDVCTQDNFSGDPSSCDVVCLNDAVGCANGDTCCPSGCNAGNDDDCGVVCGDGSVDGTETCDPPGSCPDCVDGNVCTQDNFTGDPSTCDVVCLNDSVGCANGDTCCPSGCNAGNDDDCAIVCGDGSVDGTETCDPPGSCPDCVDGDVCTQDNFSGDPSSCDVVCLNDAVGCANGDTCCPSGCNAGNDDDCAVVCGDGSVDGTETCDPPGTCPDCVDGDVCTLDNFTGDPSTCDVVCLNDPIGVCADNDGCCPTGCYLTTDNDCTADCTDPATWPPTWVAFEDQVLTLTNAERTDPAGRMCGSSSFNQTSALAMEPRLREAARCHTVDMAINDFVGHDSSWTTGAACNNDGDCCFGFGQCNTAVNECYACMVDRVNMTGYLWSTLAENVAAGQTSPAEVVTGWMASPGHCANIMDPSQAQIGVGYVFDSGDALGYRHYWTQVFGAPL